MGKRRCLQFLVILQLMVALASADETPPILRIDVAPYLSPNQNVRVVFLSEGRLLLAMNQIQQTLVGKHAWLPRDAGDSANTMVFDLEKQKVIQTIAFGNRNALKMWPTHSGNLIVQLGDHLVLYDAEFKRIAASQIPDEYARILLSPDGKLIMAQKTFTSKSKDGKWLKTFKADLLQADTLEPLDVQIPFTVDQLTDTGFIHVAEDGLYFRSFAESTDKLLKKQTKNCLPRVEVIAPDQVMIGTCDSRKGQILSLEADVVRTLDDASPSFARTSTLGNVFVLGLETYSKTHVLKNLNLLADLAGVDDPTDEMILKAYTSTSETPLLVLKWKVGKNDPEYNNINAESLVALSPAGSMLAVIRGAALEIYQLPITPQRRIN